MGVRVFGLLCALFWLGVAPLAYVELRPFLTGGQTRDARFELIASGGERVGISSYAHRLTLDNCLEAINSIYGRAQPSSRRQKSLVTCGELSAEIVAASPVNAFAWFIGAMVAAGEGNVAAMNDKLLHSRQTSPNEQWIAELRVELAENQLDDLDAPNRAGHEFDLKLMAESYRGAQSIARRYLNDVQFRERIVVLVETLPEETQARFVQNVRRAARELGLIT